MAGAETTVHVMGGGKGGRNQHFVLAALAHVINNYNPEVMTKITILSGGTDGTDGPTDAAGAVADAKTLDKAEQNKLSINDYLQNYNGYYFFKETDSLLFTGPTQTNVMDIIIVLVH